MVVNELQELGNAQGIRTRAVVLHGRNPNTTINDFCRTAQVELIVPGTSVRAGSARSLLGPAVERFIEDSPCPVVVCND